jgi:predicted SprT family Zn-dependent metalloprotease
MAYISLDEAKALANRSATESWEEMKRILVENGMEKVANRLGNMPRIEWRSMRSNRVAGYYYFPHIPHPGKVYSSAPNWDDRIEMNIKYLKSKDAIEFIWDTTKHEIGHCINYRINKRRNHDASFKAIVNAIGGNPSTCHKYENSEILEKSKTEKIHCKCGACFSLTPYRLKKAKAGAYRCKKCGTNLSDLIN